jgi:flagellar hook-associated protein 2
VLDSSNNRLRIRVNGKLSDDIILSARSYDTVAELVNELQQRIDSDTRIGSAGLEVSWIDTGSGEGHLELTSTTYGSKSLVIIDTTVSNSAAAAVGLSTGVATAGQDVAGTINGEEAVGSGQNLTGAVDNATTAGLKLKITLTEGQITPDAEGTITLAKGMASKMNAMFDSLTAREEGLLDSRIRSYENQVENLTERIAEFDLRLVSRRQRLLEQFQKMENLLAQLSAQGDYITSQVQNFNANWGTTSKN